MKEESHVLSDHVVSMQQAVVYCEHLLKTAKAIPSRNNPIFQEALQNARSIPKDREAAKFEFLEMSNRNLTADVLEVMPPTSEFRQNYVYKNRPCKIVDHNWSLAHFRPIMTAWKRTNGSANRSWFLQTLGEETLVPVRFQAENDEDSVVDDAGRAVECETIQMKVSEWIQKLDAQDSAYYLKDWHLQSWLAKEKKGGSRLYDTPVDFEKDLLNKLLLRFTDGDYRFTYWGPDGSRTGLHCDVMNSFSWSFNILGTKKWTFSIPHCSQNDEIDAKALEINQHAGECVFVPSGWPHTVENIGETLSVNHNWITAANLDLSWQVLLSEVDAVEVELQSWDTNIHLDWGARESMLLGCLGLNVTAFTLMALLGILEIFQNDLFECSDFFDIIRIGDALKKVQGDANINARKRFIGYLDDESYGAKVVSVLASTLDLVDKVFSG